MASKKHLRGGKSGVEYRQDLRRKIRDMGLQHTLFRTSELTIPMMEEMITDADIAAGESDAMAGLDAAENRRAGLMELFPGWWVKAEVHGALADLIGEAIEAGEQAKDAYRRAELLRDFQPLGDDDGLPSWIS